MLIKSYDDGIKSMRDFRAIGDARMDPALLARLQQLEAQAFREGKFWVS